MLDKYFSFRLHYFILFLGVFAIAFGLPLSRPVMSMGTILLMLNLLLQADFKTYWNNWKSNKLFFWFFIILAFHFVSLLWSDSLEYGLTDIRNKLPLFAIPVVLVATPIASKKHINYVLYGFLASLILTSAINFGSFIGLWGDMTYDDVRGMSLFQPHNQYSFLIAFGAGIALYKSVIDKKLFLLWAILFAWFAFYTFKSQIFGGVICLIVVILTLGLYAVARAKNRWVKISTFCIVSVTFIGFSLLTYNFLKIERTEFDFTNIETHSAEGNPYWHDTVNVQIENGTPIILYVQEDELRREWTKVSTLHYDSLDRKDQILRGTLFRYMASKGLKKDAEGFSQLSTADIRNIEDGTPTIINVQPGVFHRLNGLKMEIDGYFNGADPNGHSLLQRMEHLRAAKHIIGDNWLIGVGTGDVRQEFNAEYKRIESRLLPENRLRAHNQYMTIWISFGIFGLIAFLLWHFKFLQLQWRNKNAIAIAYWSIAITSYLVEDTLETQVGGTFIGLFFALWATTTLARNSQISLFGKKTKSEK